MLPKITIITPSFNQGEFLEETILSVLSQNYPNLEYLIMDGGSTDNSVDIIKKYQAQISFWVSEKDSGQAEAINKGLKRASGEIISWLCSDDVYLPDALHKVADLFGKNPDSVMLHGKAVLFGNSIKERVIGAHETELPLKYFSVIPFPQPSSFFRRKLIDEQGLLDESLHFAMDYDLLVRTALHYSLIPSNEIFSKYRMHKQSKSVSMLQEFVVEWSRVFSKFLRSVEEGNYWIEKLKSVNLFDDGTEKYNHQKKFNQEELKIITLFFLELIVHIEYGLLHKTKTSKLLSVIRNTSEGFYKKHRLNSLNFRNEFIPAPLIRLMRKYSR
jgi:glycosyltransferase involved in cell wall biosynthesis